MLIGLLSSFISTRLQRFHLAPPSPPSKLTTWCSIFYYLSYLLWIPNKSLSQTSFIASFYLISTHKMYSHRHDYNFYYKYNIVLSFRQNLSHMQTRCRQTLSMKNYLLFQTLSSSLKIISIYRLHHSTLSSLVNLLFTIIMYLLFLSVELLFFWLNKAFVLKAIFQILSSLILTLPTTPSDTKSISFSYC